MDFEKTSLLIFLFFVFVGFLVACFLSGFIFRLICVKVGFWQFSLVILFILVSYSHFLI